MTAASAPPPPGRRARATRGARSRAGAFVAALVAALVIGPVLATPARPAEWIVLCTGYDACNAAGYPDSGYKAASSTSYWRQSTGHNCTNYVAYRLVRNGMSATKPDSLSGNADNWGPSFAAWTNSSPARGAVAWWDTSYSSTGHVAYVEKVVSADEILVSEDNWGGDFRWRRITRTGGRWPTGFIHLLDQGATVADPDVYRAVAPTRILDTRSGLGAPAAKVAGGTELSLQVSGRAGLPSTGVATALLNVTVTATAASGFLTTYPSGATRPGSRSLSYGAGATLSELVPARLGSDGRVRLYTSAATHLIAEVIGWYPPSGHLVSVTPGRVLDTRTGLGTPKARLPAGGTLTLPVAGAGVVPSSGASAVVLELSAAGPSAGGWLTAWPAGATRPVTAHVRFDPGTSMTGVVVSRMGSGGAVSISSTAETDLLVDVVGWFEVGADHVAVTPARLLDTRSGLGAPAGRLAAGSTVRVPVLGRGGVPTVGVTAVSLTVTPIYPTATTAVTAFRSGTTRPAWPTVTVPTGLTRVNAVVVPVGSDGTVSLYTTAATYLVVDVQGYLKK